MKYLCRVSVFLCCISAVYIFNGCNTAKPEEESDVDNGRVKVSVEDGKVITPGSDIGTDVVDTLSYQKNGDKKEPLYLSQREKSKDKKQLPPFYDKYLKGKADVTHDANLKYDAAPLTEVIKNFSEVLEFSYLIDPQVKGTVSITMNSKMTTRELWQMFEQILWLSGAYCSPDGKVLHILPFEKMPQERRLLAVHDPHANISVELLAVRNAASKDVMEKLKPFLTEGATAIDIPHQNSILLVEAPTNIPKLKALVKMLDKKNKSEWPQAVLKCSNVSASHIKNELITILPVLGFPITADSDVAEPGSIHLVSLDRLQVLIASAANNEALEEMKRWVRILDRSDVGDQERIFIYNVVNGKADELSQALSVMFSVEGSTLSSSSGKTTAAGNNSRSSSSASSAKSKTFGSKSKGKTEDGPASVFEVPVKIFADAIQNRLVVKTTPRTYAMIKALLNRLDTPATQVLIQVMVAEVTLTKDTEFGLEFSDKQGDTSNNLLSVFGTNYKSLNPTDATAQGFTYYLSKFNNPEDKFGYIRALAGKGKVEVLSSPQIVVKSDTQAKISVGDRVPIVTEEITDTASTTNNSTALSRSIQYEDTGIILTLTPHVTKGGLITIDMKQEVSDAFENTTSDIDSPIIQERIVETSLSLRDKSTLIVAGLIRERTEDSLSGVPLIADMPVIGRLFGHSDVKRSKTEMVILITGIIIDDKTELQKMTQRYTQAMKVINKLDQETKLDSGKKK